MTIIDLGEVTEEAVAPSVPVNIPQLRRLALALLSVAGVLVLAGAAPAASTGVRQLWSTPLRQGESWSLSADTVYLTRLDDKVSAYNLTTGELRWSVPAGAELGDPRPRLVGDLLLVPADPVMISQEEADGSRYYYETVRTTIALDAATGEERWRVSGEAYASGESGTLLISDHDEQARTTRLRLIRLTDGGEVWNRPVPAAPSWTPIRNDGRIVAIAVATEGGLLSVYDYADGQLRRSTRFSSATTSKRSVTLMPAGSYLVVMRDLPVGSETAVYDAEDLRRLWYTTQSTAYVTACGDGLCDIGGGAIVGRLPRTGKEVWTLAGMRDMTLLGHDRMIVTGDAVTGDNYLADPVTGTTIGAPIVGRMVYPQDSGDMPMFLRPAVEPPGRLALVAVNPADGTQRTLGTVPPLAAEDVCITTSGYLACVRTGAQGMALDITAVG
ncbi:outer membrane protein assembly factor BamB family protein [Paractinoplanes toevensis]|uniref:Pyrrolo-quinoline quinone repeat domain-containing protein n=1 Tax=Paractinoplanes toevensis TaxID=571911 RepID=A0A919TB39_9ACTN|nr:PQQ-binding-like beta-propeller repeat protein [Actinoplanes toevensis]GIM91501.1 hypothetical protein Ato02nite_032940 [Actinoplanes toevensis]